VFNREGSGKFGEEQLESLRSLRDEMMDDVLKLSGSNEFGGKISGSLDERDHQQEDPFGLVKEIDQFLEEYESIQGSFLQSPGKSSRSSRSSATPSPQKISEIGRRFSSTQQNNSVKRMIGDAQQGIFGSRMARTQALDTGSQNLASILKKVNGLKSESKKVTFVGNIKERQDEDKRTPVPRIEKERSEMAQIASSYGDEEENNGPKLSFADL